MADFFDCIEGFEDYGPVPNGSTWDAPTNYNFEENGGGYILLLNQSWLARWVNFNRVANPRNVGLAVGLNGTGKCLFMSVGNAEGYGPQRSMKANYSRVKIGFAFKTNLAAGLCGFELLDGGTVQCGVGCDSSGRLYVTRGTINGGTTLYTSGALILSATRNWVELDITIHNSAGAFELRLNGAVVTTASSQNTRAGTNNYANQWSPRANGFGGPVKFGIDDVYVRDNSGGTAPFLGDRNVDGLTVTGDGSSIQFSPAASIVGPWHAVQTVLTNAPGANFLHLQPITADVAKTMNSVGLLPGASSGSAKFKGVIYSDSAGAPGSLLQTGTEVVGCTSGLPLTLPLASTQALVAATQYWIGYITDTSIVMNRADSWTTTAQRKANTYTSGAPAGPLSGMTTGQVPLSMWPNCTGQAVNWANLYNLPPGFVAGVGIAYNSDATVGHKDYFALSNLPGTPVTIDVVAVSVLARRSDAGARTMNIKIKSSGSEANGDNAGITPPTSFNWFTSLFTVDPNTSAAWTASGVNGIEVGYEIAS